jgi:hypothetical protein
MNDATELERKWWRRLTKVLNDMPATMEILVGAYGTLTAAKRGASKAEFKRKEKATGEGDVDNVPTLDLPPISSKQRIENNGSSL